MDAAPASLPVTIPFVESCPKYRQFTDEEKRVYRRLKLSPPLPCVDRLEGRIAEVDLLDDGVTFQICREYSWDTFNRAVCYRIVVTKAQAAAYIAKRPAPEIELYDPSLTVKP